MNEENNSTNIVNAQNAELSSATSPNIQEIAKNIKLDDPAIDVTYGTKVMQDISRFSDDLLSRVRAKDSGEIGQTLTNLMLKVKDVDIAKMNGEQGFLEKLPIIGSLFNRVEKTFAQFSTLAEQVEVISDQLDTSMIGLLKDVEILEQLYKHNESFHADLSAHLEAGKLKLEESRTVDLPKLQAEAEQSDNALDAQKVRDFADQINRFERRLHDLEISRTITIQTAPQIRLIQSNNRALAQKIQTSILTTIPIWKNQMVLALTLHGQKSAAALQKGVADTTNELLRKNAEMLEQAAVETTREVERSIVDVETLREVHAKLISTIDETLRISQEGRQKRLEVEKELSNMEVQLKDNLKSLAERKKQQSLESAQG